MSKILVTGGTGTIGRMVCRKLYANGNEVVVLSRDHGKQLVNCPRMIHEVGRIEDEHFVQHVIRKHKVHGVIHTAANKHIGVCEDRPTEAVSSNVIGSLNILRAMESNNVQHGVFVSSDKACNHNHVYGITKYLMEKLVAEYADRLTSVNCVRFGNVFGSSGSVVPIWQSLIDQGRDIELRIFDNEVVPKRLAMLPSEAACFLLGVYDNPAVVENGTVLMHREEVMVNMKFLAEAMIEGTPSKIHEVPAMKMEAERECLFSLDEADRIESNQHLKAYELTHRSTRRSLAWSRLIRHMDFDQTKEFIIKVKKEMKEWI